MFFQVIKLLLKQNKGQAMLEYIIINCTIVMAFALGTRIIIPPLSNWYNMISTMIQLPIF